MLLHILTDPWSEQPARKLTWIEHLSCLIRAPNVCEGLGVKSLEATHRFCLSFRDVEDLLTERGITVSYESVQQWCRKFDPVYAGAAKERQGRLGDTWYLDEVLGTIQGQRH